MNASPIMLQFSFFGLIWILALLLALTFAAPIVRRRCAGSPSQAASQSSSPSQRSENGASAPWELMIETVRGNGSGPATERLVMQSERVTIGRGSEAGLTLDDEFISTVHAALRQTDGKLIFEDLGSTNGSFINGLPVSAPAALQHGDVVRMGKTEIRVL